MSLSALFSKGAGEVVGNVMKGLDGLFTSDDERNKAKVLLNGQLNTLVADMIAADVAQEAERTKRHESDMKSDSWLSKNIRPLSLCFLLLLFLILVIADSGFIAFTVREQWINLLETLLTAAFSFYFVMRGSEKMMSIYAGMKEKSV